MDPVELSSPRFVTKLKSFYPHSIGVDVGVHYRLQFFYETLLIRRRIIYVGSKPPQEYNPKSVAYKIVINPMDKMRKYSTI